MYLTRLEKISGVAGCQCERDIGKLKLEWSPTVSVCVVMASGGYPGNYPKGKVITGLTEAGKLPHTKVSTREPRWRGRVVTNGGRVLGVTSWGKRPKTARKMAYEAVEKIKFDGAHFDAILRPKALN